MPTHLTLFKQPNLRLQLPVFKSPIKTVNFIQNMPIYLETNSNNIGKYNMKFQYNLKINILLILLYLVFASAQVQASEKTKVLIHVTSSNKANHTSVINNVNALLKEYGKNGIDIEIVANGRGVGIANKKNAIRTKITPLLEKGVRLSVCNASIHKLKSIGQEIPLINGAIQVKNGTIHLIKLQQQGYLYLKL